MDGGSILKSLGLGLTTKMRSGSTKAFCHATTTITIRTTLGYGLSETTAVSHHVGRATNKPGCIGSTAKNTVSKVIIPTVCGHLCGSKSIVKCCNAVQGFKMWLK